MGHHQQELRLVVDHADLDTEQLADLTEQLRQEVDESGLGEARRTAESPGPEGAKGDALAWTELLLTFTGGLPALVALIRSWTQSDQGRKVKLELAGDTLELSGLSSAEQEHLVTDWVNRHQAAT